MKKIFLSYICTLCLLIGGLYYYTEKYLGPNLKKKINNETAKITTSPISIESIGVHLWPIGLQAKNIKQTNEDYSFVLKKILLTPSFKSLFQNNTIIHLRLENLSLKYKLKKRNEIRSIDNSSLFFRSLASMPAPEINIPFLGKRNAHINLDIADANIQLNIDDTLYRIHNINFNIQLRNHKLSYFITDFKIYKNQKESIPVLIIGKYLLNNESLQIKELTAEILEMNFKSNGIWDLKTNSRTGNLYLPNKESLEKIKKISVSPFFKSIKNYIGLSLSIYQTG